MLGDELGERLFAAFVGVDVENPNAGTGPGGDANVEGRDDHHLLIMSGSTAASLKLSPIAGFFVPAVIGKTRSPFSPSLTAAIPRWFMHFVP